MINTTYIDQKYIRFLSNRLKGFRDKGNGLFEFAHTCESAVSRKRRGYFYQKGQGYNFICHHCNESTKFFKFLENMDPMLFKEYRMEVFKEDMGEKASVDVPKVEVKKETVRVGIDSNLEPYSSLLDTHPAMKMVKQRKIPVEMYKDIYFCKNFFLWAAKYNPAFSKVHTLEPRLILPYRDQRGKIFGFTCRSYGKSDKKYIEIKVDPDAEMVYGLDRVNTSKTILCLEGPIDSMFLPNAIAVGGASYTGTFVNRHKNNCVIVPDNDWKRNILVLKQIEKMANEGYKVALLPDSYKAKDINTAIQTEAFTAKQINDMIMSSVKTGPELLLEIAFRRKC